MEELAAEVPDGPIPYKVELPHTDCPVTTHRAVSFTGTRFINVFTLSASATEPSRSTKRARATLSVTRDTADEGHLDPEAPEARGIVLLAEIMNGKARTQLNCQAVVDLVAATAYSQATPLFEMLPDYLAPMLQNVHMRQVRARYLLGTGFPSEVEADVHALFAKTESASAASTRSDSLAAC